MPAILNITKDQRFGRLTVVQRIKVPNARNVMWECLCDCGNAAIAAAANLGKSQVSCGCLRKEKCAATLRGNTNTRTHNKSKSPEYRNWSGMKTRCYNPNNVNYPEWGGRGIAVCDRWKFSFESFLEDMGMRPSPGHTIERVDNSRGYSPDNCVWATRKSQARNTRNNRMVTIDGRSMCVAKWSEYAGFPYKKPWALTDRREGRRPKFDTVDEAVRHLVMSSRGLPRE